MDFLGMAKQLKRSKHTYEQAKYHLAQAGANEITILVTLACVYARNKS